jgi:cytochrome c oxidase subunit III
MIAIAAQNRQSNIPRLSMALFIVESLFLAAIVGAFIFFKITPGLWPPAGQPRLPVIVTALNTLILILSAVTFQIAFENLNSLDTRKYIVFLNWLEITVPLGLVFLVIQGSEWVRLIHFGIAYGSGIHELIFCSLIGLYGLQTFGGLAALIWMKYHANHGRYFNRAEDVGDYRIIWFFIVTLWPVLYFLLYL